MPQRAIGQIIRDRRLELGLTQEELAERVSAEGEWLQQADVSRIETGRVRLPHPARLQRIADVLGLSLGDLLLYASGLDAEGQVLVEHPEEAASPMCPPGKMWDDPHLYRRLLEGLDQAVFVTDPDGILRYWNAYAEELFGWQAGEVLGQDAAELLVANRWEWQEQVDAVLDQLVAGHRWHGEMLVRRGDGKTFMAYMALTPVRSVDGTMIAVFGTSHELHGRPGSPRV